MPAAASSVGLPISRGLVALALLAPTIALFAGLQIGWWLGRAGQATKKTPEAAPVAPAAEVVTEPQLTGRVSWRNASGETKPDVGAVVILWPEQWDGATRLSPVGLRPADNESDQAAAAGLVAGMGGHLARTDADGAYELTVPKSGRYRRLIISRLQARPDKAPIPPAVLGELQQYLSDPTAAIGERAYSWQPQTVDTGRNPPADQVF
jgi:hypothetical protein